MASSSYLLIGFPIFVVVYIGVFEIGGAIVRWVEHRERRRG